MNSHAVVRVLQILYITTMRLSSGGTSSLRFQADAEEVFVNSRLVFTCASNSPVKQILWRRLAKGETLERVIVSHEFVGNTCSAPDDTGTLQCYCNSTTVYTCAINAVDVSNDTDSWRCSAALDGISMYSNRYNINILIKLSGLTLLPRPISALSYPIYNDTSVFMCITSQSKPAAKIQWFEDETNITDHANDRYSSYVTTSVLRYTPKSLSNKTVSCRAIYQHLTIFVNQTASVDLLIQYPVSIPVIATKTRNVSQNVNIGENIAEEFRCHSSGYPPPSYFWTYPGGNRTGDVVKLQLNRTSHGHFIQCVETNTYYYLNGSTGTQQTKQSASLRMNVSYHPTFKRFKYNDINFTDTNVRVVKGDSIIFTSEWDANPPATVYWQEQQSDSSILTLTYIQHDMSFTCLAFNVILDDTGQVTKTHAKTTLSVSVLYGPEVPKFEFSINSSRLESVRTNASIDLIEGSNLKLICTTESNPSSLYTWGAGYDSALLNISNINRDGIGTFTCTARNTMVTSLKGNVTGSSNATVLVNIMYPPTVQRMINHTVLLNTSVTVSCNLKSVGNPTETHFTWLRNGYNTTIFIGTIASLTIHHIELKDEGEYQCKATNIMKPIGNDVVYGVSETTFYIDVQYEATILTFNANESANTITINQGETIKLVCDAEGDPKPFVRIINATNGRELILIEKERVVHSYIHQAKCEYDSGAYTCMANNIHNMDEHIEKLMIYIKCSPRPSPFSPTTRIVYSAPNNTAIFNFTIIAYPEPEVSDFSWSKRIDEGWMIVSRENTLIVKMSDTIMQTNLVIGNVRVDDYTDYMVKVSNALGSTADIFTLRMQSKPDVPNHFRVDRVGENDIVIAWIPGFNGGEQQTFTIRYKVVGIDSRIDINVARSMLSYKWTIEGLTPGTTYQIKMQAENKIGKSEWTEEITQTTLVDTVDSDSSTSAVGGAVGGLLGVGVLITLIIGIWRRRLHHGNTVRDEICNNMVGHYEDLVRQSRSTTVLSIDGVYDTCRFDSKDSRDVNTYVALEQYECREYSSISTAEIQQVNTSEDGQFQLQASTQIMATTDDRIYVNMQISEL